MGTNYYYKNNEDYTLPPDGKHIGKSSLGWCFALHVYPLEGIFDLSDWFRIMSKPGDFIESENRRYITIVEMLDIITNRSAENIDTDLRMPPLGTFVPGPRGLLRNAIHPPRVLGHGAGTWDLLTGDFS